MCVFICSSSVMSTWLCEWYILISGRTLVILSRALSNCPLQSNTQQIERVCACVKNIIPVEVELCQFVKFSG